MAARVKTERLAVLRLNTGSNAPSAARTQIGPAGAPSGILLT